MRESEIQFDNYDYIVFVDASGDDGFNFKERSCDGSSFSFVSSCFVVKPEDIQHNTNVLQEMKAILNIAPEKELKSTTLKRHRFASQAYAKIDELIGQCFSMVAFKKDLLGKPEFAPYCDVRTKRLSGLTQAFPYYAIHKTKYFSPVDKILIVMDNMKKSEMNVVEDCLKNYEINPMVSSKYDVIFRDSKSEKYTLIQIADIMAGLVREYFESNMQTNTLQRLCRICRGSKTCDTKKRRRMLNEHTIEQKFITPFFMHKSPIMQKIMLVGIITFPISKFEYYKYIDCKFRNKKRS